MKKKQHPVRVLREYTEETQQEVGWRIACTGSYVSLVENSVASMGARTALNFVGVYRDEMEHLGIGLEDVLRGEMPTRRKNARRKS